MTEVTDDDMRTMLTKSAPYSVVLLERGPAYGSPGSDAVVWEHGRRNFELRAAGLLAVVCPVPDDSDLCGVGIFTPAPDEVARLMDDDPGVRAGVFTYAVHPCRSFPGDALPAPAGATTHDGAAGPA
jgi:hypothetical protein